MAKSKVEADTEAVLMALDQLSQTMDVMRQVVGRLKRRVEAAERGGSLSAQESTQPSINEEGEAIHKDRTLH